MIANSETTQTILHALDSIEGKVEVMAASSNVAIKNLERLLSSVKSVNSNLVGIDRRLDRVEHRLELLELR